MELGRDEAAIRVSVHADEKLHLAFGSGEEFTGYCGDLPVPVGYAAREILGRAPSLGRRLAAADGAPSPRAWGAVRFTLRTPTSVRAGESPLSDLAAGRSDLAPLWAAFSDLLGPLIVALFKAPAEPDRAAAQTPALARARRLWPPRHHAAG